MAPTAAILYVGVLRQHPRRDGWRLGNDTQRPFIAPQPFGWGFYSKNKINQRGGAAGVWPVAKTKLSNRQELFCKEYIIDLNATQAAIRAGYAETSARTQSARLIAKDNIQARIAELSKGREERLQIDADWVLKQASEAFLFNANAIVDQYGNNVMTNATAAARFLELTGKHTAVGAFGKDETGRDDAQPLHISFSVNEPKDKIEVTNGDS